MSHFAQRAVLHLLKAYKWAISPMFPPACRYVPTCSEYAMEAIERFGVFRGGMKAVWRLLRCHPFVRGGFDPVVKDAAPSDSSNLVENATSFLWNSGASGPRQSAPFLSGFSPCEHSKRNL